MFSSLKKLFGTKSKTAGGNWKTIHTDLFRISHPEEYTLLHEGGLQVTGFCRGIGKNTGVLRFTPILLKKNEDAEKMLLGAKETHLHGEEILIGNHTCWRTREEKKHSSTDYMFWTDTGEPILMDVYFFTDKKTFFLFSYRIPLSMTQNGMYEKEKPVIFKIIESVKAI